MLEEHKDKLVVAISSRALFDFEDENAIFESGRVEDYRAAQLERLESPAAPGVAFHLIRKLLALNTPDAQRVEVVVLSRNDPVSGLRVFRSAEAHGLPVTRGAFTHGRSPFAYLRSLDADLFLSANADDVRAAITDGFAAAQVYAGARTPVDNVPDEIRIAFDGDSVLFSDQAERVYRSEKLAAFEAHEKEKALLPLPPGPFKPFLAALHRLQKAAPQERPVRIRTALVTARGAPAHDRAIRTLMAWNLEVDEAFFLGGLDKGPFLREFQPDFFFDDQARHVQSAALSGPAGQVLYGIANQQEIPDAVARTRS
jgi:5'-nucleotidase